MGRKQKYSKDLKIEICKKFISGEKSAKELSNIYDLGRYGDDLVITWVRQYQKNGSLIFEEKQINTSYSKEFKINVVIDYLSGKGSIRELANKYGIPSKTTVWNWILKYNNHIELKDYTPQSEVYMATKLKTTLEERVEVVKYCLDHNRDIKGTAAHFNGNYAQIYQWVKKYEKFGEEGLKDKRGRKKLETELTEIEKAQRRIAQLEAEVERQKKINELLKKVDALERNLL